MSPTTGTIPQPSKCLSMTLAFQTPSSKTHTPINSVGTQNTAIKPHWFPHLPPIRNPLSISEWTLARSVFQQTPPSLMPMSNSNANLPQALPCFRCMKWNQTSGLKMNSLGTEAQTGTATTGKMAAVPSPQVQPQPASTPRKPPPGSSLDSLPAFNRGSTLPRTTPLITSLSHEGNTATTPAQVPSRPPSTPRKLQKKQTNHL